MGAFAGSVDWFGNTATDWQVTEAWLLENFPEYADLTDGTNGGASASASGG